MKRLLGLFLTVLFSSLIFVFALSIAACYFWGAKAIGLGEQSADVAVIAMAMWIVFNHETERKS